MKKFKKVIEDGNTAVLVSYGYGAGWYTWNLNYPGLVFDSEIVSAVRKDNLTLAKEIAEKKYPDAYLGGIDGLQVEWVPEGMQFEIREYDGAESLHIIGQGEYLTA